ncbi:MAG TPA: hypothetical protein PLD84_11575 [Chitinophagales bacterium]|nr:hypothetical protein [Chitinophagales bacterium]
MSNQPSVFKAIALFAVALVLAVAVSSCGSQKMGCPGSITSTEQPAAAHS